MAGKGAESATAKKRHAHWDKVVSAAYLRMQGRTQEEAASAVGRAARTLRTWEANVELWAAARAEARERWYNDVEDAARTAVLRSTRLGNATLGLQVLERLDKRLAPPQQRHDLTSGGRPLQVFVKGSLDTEQPE